jgi:hypothetical protein
LLIVSIFIGGIFYVNIKKLPVSKKLFLSILQIL